jgi:AraC-like DNA-binding protein
VTFADAAVAYQLVQSGCSLRLVAPHFGVSHTHLARTIASCLEHGQASRYIDAAHIGRPETYTPSTMEQVRRLREDNVPYGTIAKRLDTDTERLRRAFNYYHKRKDAEKMIMTKLREATIQRVEEEYGEPFPDVVRGYAVDGEGRYATADILGISRTTFARMIADLDIPWRRAPETNSWVQADRYSKSEAQINASLRNIHTAQVRNAERFAATRRTTDELMTQVADKRRAGVSWRNMPKAVSTDLGWTTLRRRHNALERQHGKNTGDR